jgi:hypothetical protein
MTETDSAHVFKRQEFFSMMKSLKLTLDDKNAAKEILLETMSHQENQEFIIRALLWHKKVFDPDLLKIIVEKATVPILNIVTEKLSTAAWAEDSMQFFEFLIKFNRLDYFQQAWDSEWFSWLKLEFDNNGGPHIFLGKYGAFEITTYLSTKVAIDIKYLLKGFDFLVLNLTNSTNSIMTRIDILLNDLEKSKFQQSLLAYKQNKLSESCLWRTFESLDLFKYIFDRCIGKKLINLKLELVAQHQTNVSIVSFLLKQPLLPGIFLSMCDFTIGIAQEEMQQDHLDLLIFFIKKCCSDEDLSTIYKYIADQKSTDFNIRKIRLLVRKVDFEHICCVGQQNIEYLKELSSNLDLHFPRELSNIILLCI